VKHRFLRSKRKFIYTIIPSILIVIFVLITASVKILREYERAVVFTLGRFQKVKGPGLVLLIPFVQEMVRVDLRIQVIEIPTQDVISRSRDAPEDLGGVDKSLRGLELGFRMDDLGAPVALRLRLLGDGAYHVVRELDGSDLDVAHLDPPGFSLGV
jgi:hypothetical protein